MTMEIVQTDEYGNVNSSVNVEVSPDNVLLSSEPPDTYDAPTSDSGEETWEEIQVKATRFFANLPENAANFFKNNRQSFNTLGLILLAFLGIRVLFAVLDAIDDIPFMAFVLRLVGFVYLTQFVWRYLMRASDRQELAQKIETVKTDLLGN
jgi:CAAD domains of cyanobacterial aminoacyl-tRNA synthetase